VRDTLLDRSRHPIAVDLLAVHWINAAEIGGKQAELFASGIIPSLAALLDDLPYSPLPAGVPLADICRLGDRALEVLRRLSHRASTDDTQCLLDACARLSERLKAFQPDASCPELRSLCSELDEFIRAPSARLTEEAAAMDVSPRLASLTGMLELVIKGEAGSTSPERVLGILTSLLHAPAVASAEAAVPLLKSLARLIFLGPPQSRGAAQVVSKLIGCCTSEGWTEALIPAALEAFAACAASALAVDTSDDPARWVERRQVLCFAADLAFTLSGLSLSGDTGRSPDKELALGAHAGLALGLSVEALRVFSDTREVAPKRLSVLEAASSTLRRLRLHAAWRASEPQLAGLYPALLHASKACRQLAGRGGLSAQEQASIVTVASNAFDIVQSVVSDGRADAAELQRQV